MSFQPVVPLSGYAGWSFLRRTRDAQQAAFDKSGQIARDTAYFADRIGAVKDADALVSDRRLLRVALGAFGLDADIDSRFFVRKVLSEGTRDDKALSNRLADKRYGEMARSFGFDLGTPSTVLSDFADRITRAYRERQFEVAVGEQDQNLRLALGVGRDLGAIAGRDTTEKGRWYAVMGNKPLRTVMEGALGLPSSFGALDLDLQLQGFRDAADRVFGDSGVSQFTDPARQEKLIRLFLLRSEAQSSAISSQGQIALTLLGAS